MSNRRGRGRAATAYSVRVQRRSVARGPRRRPADPRRRPVPVHRLPALVWLSVGLAVAAELGHLGTAYVEWPESAIRGGYHVAAGALLGLVAAVLWSGATAAGAAVAGAVAATGPVLWLGGAVLGAAPYADLPVLAAAGLAAAELVLAALLFDTARARRRQPAAPALTAH
ncbi:MAG: hypothetical protein GEV12_23100 [Micromonosporaceae bacterium]|nr:hypothetical protein [Micromonosporaceae bacterium]